MWGNVTVSPMMVLNITSNPSESSSWKNSAITVNVSYDRNGIYHDSINGHIQRYYSYFLRIDL